MKKVAAVLLASSMLLCMTACGTKDPYDGSRVKDSENTLDIITINKGYGTKWLEALADKYSADHPDVTITIKRESEDTTINALLESGGDSVSYSKYDLFFGATDAGDYVSNALKNPETSLLAELSEVYNYDPDGKGKAKDRVADSLMTAFERTNINDETVYYTLPWTDSVSGLLVNDDVLKAHLGENWEAEYPIRTTDEFDGVLNALTQAISQKGTQDTYAMIHSGNTNYYHFLYYVWWAQYEGLDGIADYYNGLYFDEVTQTKKVGTGIFLQQGRLEALKAMEKVMDAGKGYSYPTSDRLNWNETQMYFMLGRAGFFPNGDWNNLEMEKTFPDSNVKFVRMPVVSALGTKLGITEAELKSVVSYVDTVNDGGSAEKPTLNPSAVGGKNYTVDEIIAEVDNARRMSFSYANYHTAYVANYGLGKKHAIDFLKFMTSEEGQRIYASVMNGPSTPFGFDAKADETLWDGFNEFAKSRYKVAKNTNYMFLRNDLPLGAKGMAAFRADSLAPIEALLHRSDNRMTAQQIFDVDYNYYNGKTTWTDLLRRAGLM